MIRFIKTLSLFFLFFLIIGFVTLSYYQPLSLVENNSFHKNVELISAINFKNKLSRNYTSIGWSRANITPHGKVNTTRGMVKKPFESVLDSLFVSCIYLKSGMEEFVIVSYDLLLVTPSLAKAVRVKFQGLGISNVYFSASHTHSAFGNYGKGIVSEIALGEFKQVLLDDLVNKTELALKQAINKQDTLLNISFSEKKINRCINRLTKAEYVDEGLRQIHFSTHKAKAILSSLNIHPTFNWARTQVMSKDYPRIFSKDKKNEFGMFVAGTMGSINPINYKIDTMQITKFKEFIDATGYSTYADTIKNVELINFHSIQLETPILAPLLTESIAASSWLTSLLLGPLNTSIEVLRIGEVLMIALPCELSAEYYSELQELAESKGLYLMVTSFNGSYLGYATPSRNFEIDHSETRNMNWLGKYGGDYFSELVKVIIEKQS